jgi:hypothetical protein
MNSKKFKNNISSTQKHNTNSEVIKKNTSNTPLSSSSKNPETRSTQLSSIKDNITEMISEKVQLGAYSIGNSIEAFGKKIQKKGYSKLGSRVEKIGDRIENIGNQNNK